MNIEIQWHKEDVFKVRSDLTDAEAEKVLTESYLRHTKETGMTYKLVEEVAEELFPRARQRELKEYRVTLGRRIIQKMHVDLEAHSENEAEAEILKAIKSGKFIDTPFRTTAITGEFIYDLGEKIHGKIWRNYV